jgi:hypothetical protein
VLSASYTPSSPRLEQEAIVGTVFLTDLHLERQRAESLGSTAKDYEPYRPSFPDALIDDFVTLTGPLRSM